MDILPRLRQLFLISALLSSGAAFALIVPPLSEVETLNQQNDFAGALDDMLNGIHDNGWPRRPRRSLVISRIYRHTSTFSVGLTASALGIGFTLSREALFALNWKSHLLIIRHSPQAEYLLAQQNDGLIQLAEHEKSPLFAECTYSASASGSIELVGNVSLFGVSCKNKEELEQQLRVEQGSKFFRIKNGDSIPYLQELCFKHFKDFVEVKVTEDLKNIIVSNIFLLGEGVNTNQQKAIRKALYGYPEKTFLINKRTIEVFPASTYKDSKGRFNVRGSLLDKKIWGLNTTIVYQLVYQNGHLDRAHYHAYTAFGESSSNTIVDALKEFVEALGSEALLHGGAA